MRKLISLLFVVATAFSMLGCSGGGAEEAVSDKPAGDISNPSKEGGPKAGAGGGAAMAAPEPTPPPASN